MADNRLVTEWFLNDNFEPKPGITPGTDNIRAMDCDQIKARYKVEISGVTSTGLRCPGRDQIVSAENIGLINNLGSTFSSQDPVTLPITIPSNTKLLVVTINGVIDNRVFAAPTVNGVSMLSGYGNSYAAECWYLLNPSSGTFTLSVPNSGSATLVVNATAYGISTGSISLYDHARTGGTSNNPNSTVNIPQNKQVLIVDCVTYRNYNSNSLVRISNSDNYIRFSVIGSVQGGSEQYVSFFSGSSTQRTLSWQTQNQHTHSTVVTVFQV